MDDLRSALRELARCRAESLEILEGLSTTVRGHRQLIEHSRQALTESYGMLQNSDREAALLKPPATQSHDD